MTMIKCSKCGKEISSHAKSCTYCESIDNNKEIGLGKSLLIIFGFIMSLVFLFAFIDMNHKNEKKKIFVKPSQQYNEITEKLYAQLNSEIKENNPKKVMELARKIIQYKKTDYKDFLSITTKYLYEYVKPIPASNYEKNYEIYSFLNALAPDNPLYAKKRDYYSEIVAKKRKTENSQIIRKEIEKPTGNTDTYTVGSREKHTSNFSRKQKVKRNFSTWDGSHKSLVKYVKERMHDPDSFEHVGTRYTDKGKIITVCMKYRGNNAFGAKVLNTICAETNIDGDILKIVAEG